MEGSRQDKEEFFASPYLVFWKVPCFGLHDPRSRIMGILAIQVTLIYTRLKMKM